MFCSAIGKQGDDRKAAKRKLWFGHWRNVRFLFWSLLWGDRTWEIHLCVLDQPDRYVSYTIRSGDKSKPCSRLNLQLVSVGNQKCMLFPRCPDWLLCNFEMFSVCLYAVQKCEECFRRLESFHLPEELQRTGRLGFKKGLSCIYSCAKCALCLASFLLIISPLTILTVEAILEMLVFAVKCKIWNSDAFKSCCRNQTHLFRLCSEFWGDGERRTSTWTKVKHFCGREYSLKIIKCK